MAINLGKAKSLTSGGEAFIEKDMIADEANRVVTHTDLDARATDWEVDQTMQSETPQPVKGFQNIDPTWLVNVSSDRRITSITLQAFAGSPATDAVLIIRRAGEAFYQKFLGAISDVAETTFDLTTGDFVPIDLIDLTAYTFTVVSQTGMQIELTGDFPNLPFYSWEYYELTPQTLAYESDLDSSTGAFYVDLNTTIPASERNGSLFKPFISMTEALANVPAPTVMSQNTFICASGDYGETFVLPTYSHIVNQAADNLSVEFNQITFNDNFGTASITSCRVNTFNYDTTAAGGSTQAVFKLMNISAPSNISLIGRGAGSDVVIMDRFSFIDDINAATNVWLQIAESIPLDFTGNLNAVGTNAATNLKNGDACLVTLSDCNFEDANIMGLTGDTASVRVEIRDCIIPTTTTNGNNVTIARDSNSVFSVIPLVGTPTFEELDKIEQVDHGPQVVYVTEEADFGTVNVGVDIDVLPDTTFVLNEPITQTLPFTIATGANMEIKTTNRSENTLTYTNTTDAQFQGTNIGNLNLTDVIFDGDNNATLFNIDGGEVNLKFPDFVDYDDLGLLDNMTDVFAPGVLFDVISTGLVLTDCARATISTCLFIAQQGNLFDILTIDGASSGDVQIIDNFVENDADSSFVNVDGATYPAGSTVTLSDNDVEVETNFFGPGSIDETDNRMLVRGNKAVKDSKSIGALHVTNNATTTSLVINTWTDFDLNNSATASSNIERFSVSDTDTGELTYDGLADFSGYLVASVSGLGQPGADTYQFRAVVNGAPTADGIITETSTNANSRSIVLVVPLALVTNDTVRLQIQNITGGDDFTITQVSIAIQ